MCCLFGLIDWNHAFTQKEKNKIIRALSIAAEARGTDATGFAYNAGGRIHIYKRPLPARMMTPNFPDQAAVIMGHTRMTTQGSEKKYGNNHPFPGHVAGGRFALAHNGVLYNDKTLRKKLRLPKSSIDTDSYVAVQLIEKKNTLDLNSLKYMAEQVRGSFTFTVLDEGDNLYIVKGENPMAMVRFDNGAYLYASTKSILEIGIRNAGLSKLGRTEHFFYDGNITRFAPDGSRDRVYFNLEPRAAAWDSWLIPDTRQAADNGYHTLIREYAAMMGIPAGEIEYLIKAGLSGTDLEIALYDDDFREACLDVYGYFALEGLENECAGCYAW